MKLLKVFNKENIPDEKKKSFQKEFSVRAVVIDNSGKIALLYSKEGDFYVLPGGGIEEGETSKKAIIRECKEETGCNVEILKEVGKTIEIRAKKNTIKESFCYLVKILGEKGKPNFQEEELSLDFIVIWITKEKAKEKIKNNKISDNLYYNYITERDLLFLSQI